MTSGVSHSAYLCCLSFTVEFSSSWVNKFQVRSVPIGKKARTEGSMAGSGHSYHKADGLQDFGGGVGPFCHKSTGKQLDHARVIEPHGFQQ